MNNQGWECPKCGYVYAPYMTQCTNCNRPEHEKVSTNTEICGEPVREALPNLKYFLAY